MFVCAINVGLRGGDFCSLNCLTFSIRIGNIKHRRIMCLNKMKRDKDGIIIRTKHIELSWNNDFEIALSEWLSWLNNYDSEQKLDDYIFKSQKSEYLVSKEWWKIMEDGRRDAGIEQKIGTHGLRKTFRHYWKYQASLVIVI